MRKKEGEITFLDICRAVDAVHADGLFHFHEHPNPRCPVGLSIHQALDGKLAQVVKIIGDEVTLQVFSGTEGIRTNAEVVFMGKPLP